MALQKIDGKLVEVNPVDEWALVAEYERHKRTIDAGPPRPLDTVRKEIAGLHGANAGATILAEWWNQAFAYYIAEGRLVWFATAKKDGVLDPEAVLVAKKKAIDDANAAADALRKKADDIAAGR